MAKAGTWIIAVHDSAKDESVLCSVYGETESVKQFMAGMILRAREADKDSWNADCSSIGIEGIRTNKDGTLYGCAGFYDYHIDYTAIRLEDIMNLGDCQERRAEK